MGAADVAAHMPLTNCRFSAGSSWPAHWPLAGRQLRQRGGVEQQLLHPLVFRRSVVATDLASRVDQHQVRAVHQPEVLGTWRRLALESQLEALLGGLTYHLQIAREKAPGR